MARDDFTKPTKNQAYQRVAGRCSNPDCHATTSAPVGEVDFSKVGGGAHIHAASPGGGVWIGADTTCNTGPANGPYAARPIGRLHHARQSVAGEGVLGRSRMPGGHQHVADRLVGRFSEVQLTRATMSFHLRASSTTRRQLTQLLNNDVIELS